MRCLPLLAHNPLCKGKHCWWAREVNESVADIATILEIHAKVQEIELSLRNPF